MLFLGLKDWVRIRSKKGLTECRYLVDGLNPMDVGDLPTRAQMVLVTSPDPRIYQVRHAGILLKTGRAEVLTCMSWPKQQTLKICTPMFLDSL
jgi:hypothetical protein